MTTRWHGRLMAAVLGALAVASPALADIPSGDAHAAYLSKFINDTGRLMTGIREASGQQGSSRWRVPGFSHPTTSGKLGA